MFASPEPLSGGSSTSPAPPVPRAGCSLAPSRPLSPLSFVFSAFLQPVVPTVLNTNKLQLTKCSLLVAYLCPLPNVGERAVVWSVVCPTRIAAAPISFTEAGRRLLPHLASSSASPGHHNTQPGTTQHFHSLVVRRTRQRRV